MYIDTSALVPYYCPEPLSRAAEGALRSDPRPSVSDLVEVEFFSALSQRFGRERWLRPKPAALADSFSTTRRPDSTIDSPSTGLTMRPRVTGLVA